MKFYKDLMIERVTKEGKADMITPDVIKIMDNLDGQEASESCWERVVKGAPILYVIGKDGRGDYVFEGDCK